MERVLYALVSAFILVLASNSFSYAALDVAKASKGLPLDMARAVSQIPSKAHFLLGLEPKDDEWEQFLMRRKVFQTNDLFYGYAGSGIADKSTGNYRIPNTQLSEVLALSGKQVTIVYTHHHFTSEEMYTFWSRIGEKNLAEFSPLYRKYEVQWGVGQLTDGQWKSVRQILGWAQFEAVKAFVHYKLHGGLAKNLKDYADMNLTRGVVEARAKLLDDSSYGKRLDESVPGAPGLKVRDIIPVPLTRPQDFLPDLLIIGPRGFYGGFANWKTPDMERIVFLDLLGLALSYVGKSHAVIAHELVHTNPYLQGLPISFYYDIEMWADLTTGLDSDMMEFLHHPYQAVVRDMVRNHWGYDSEEVKRRIWPGSFGVLDIREKEFRAHAAEVKKIRNELLKFIKDPKDGLMVMFYRDPYYWLTVNTKFCDTAAAWRILFTLRYEPAGLFDPDKRDKDGKVIPPVQQTKEWLSKELEAGRIKRLADQALKKTGQESAFAKKMSKVEAGELMKCPVHSRFFLMTDQEKQKFLEFIEPVIERAKKGDIEARMLLMRIFGGSGAFRRMTTR